MKTKKYKFINYKLLIIVLFICPFSVAYAQKAYFDLSQNEISIDTDFKGQELILFGLTEADHHIIVVVRGPKENLTVRNKKRILGFWFNTKSVTYINVPKVYFISTNHKIENLLNKKEIYENEIGFSNIKFIPKNQKDLFIDLKEWNESVIRIQKERNLYKIFELKFVDDKLFQTRLYFPSNVPTGKYIATTYRIKNDKILSFNNKIIWVNKSGIGNKIFMFAHQNSILYGIATIIFAIIIGASAALIFRKLY